MKNKQKRKVLIIGSGPIIIGQAAEFDYSGTQACLALRTAGVESVLVNSNPATIQTDKTVADKVYILPLNVESLEKVISKEKPYGLIGTMGGQTALNLTKELWEKGLLTKYNVKILGTSIEAIIKGEDRNEFKKLMLKIGEPVLSSVSTNKLSEAEAFAKEAGYPLIFRAAYTLGGTGSCSVNNLSELKTQFKNSVEVSPIGQVLVEKSIYGWGEFEFEVVRDKAGNSIIVCSMENIDPMGIHTGESMVVAPVQTLNDNDLQMLRSSALKIAEAIKIEGGFNVQFAFNYETGEHFVIEVNPRLSRSSALASKATGYPIAKIATQIALGKTLPEIKNEMTGKTAFFEPALDYIVVKIPCWPDDKFWDMNKTIGITMKSTGETMAIAKSFEQAMYKAIKSLGLKYDVFSYFDKLSDSELVSKLTVPNTQRLSAIFSALNKGWSVEKIGKLTKINNWFLFHFKNLLTQKDEIEEQINGYCMVDTCAGEFEAKTPYFFSTNTTNNEAISGKEPKVIILGSGPIKIGQGIEFDYMTVHAIQALKKKGIKAIVINNNPETVSTDYQISDRLYFEPLTNSFVQKVIDNEKAGLLGVICQFGGQTALELSLNLNCKVLGTQPQDIINAEDRQSTAKIIEKLGFKMPKWKYLTSTKNIFKEASDVGYPILVRPSYVIGGEGMAIINNEPELNEYIETIKFNEKNSGGFLIDKFLSNAKEFDVDFISDVNQTQSFILEQIEPAGIHSGDSSCIYPAQSLNNTQINQIEIMVEQIAKAFKIIGLGNIQLAIKDHEIYVLEVNSRASRTIPFLNKCIDVPLVQIATDVILGKALAKIEFGKPKKVYLKKPIFSFNKLDGVSQKLGPLMKSTGEEMLLYTKQ